MSESNQYQYRKFNLKNEFKIAPVTMTLIAINLVVFLLIYLTNFLIEQDWLVNSFSKITYMISMEKEYYRFLTAVFVHQAPMHLFFNMMALFFLGKPIEYIFGKSRFIMLFIISGLFGTLGSFVFSANAAIGASGAVFGIFGVHAYLFIKNREVYLKWFNKDVIQLLVINIVIGFIIPNIDYWGHFGGLVGGFLVASTFGLSRHVSLVKSVIIGSIISLVIFTSTFFIFNKAYVDYIEYVDTALVELTQAIASEDVDQVISIRDDMLDKKPSFPPIPDDDMYQSINLNIFRLSQ